MLHPTTVLSAHTSELPESPHLDLLPFSLGSSSTPYKSTNEPLSTYFKPRPAPQNCPGVSEGTTIAYFRGKQIVAQDVLVPNGYKGYVIAGDRPELVRYSSGMEENLAESSSSKGMRRKWPLTPATSTSSTVETASLADEDVMMNGITSLEDGLELKRSPRKMGALANLKKRVKGAGQVALARPKRAIARMSTKRYRLDSDDEGDDAPAADAEKEDEDQENDKAQSRVWQTPRKKARTDDTTITTTPISYRQSPRLQRQIPTTPRNSDNLPRITIQHATPLKSPLPPPPPHLKTRRRNKTDYIVPGSDEPCLPPAENENHNYGDVSSDLGAEEEEDSIIPSPATESDPPTFSIPSIPPTPRHNQQSTATPSNTLTKSNSLPIDIHGPIRILRPVSTFDKITLWTPDGPLAGYDNPASGLQPASTSPDGAAIPTGEEEKEDVPENADTQSKDGGIKLKSSWWKQGGAGEGGDEIVRVMGEWIGLVEMINKPTYLDKFKEDLDDEDN